MLKINEDIAPPREILQTFVVVGGGGWGHFDFVNFCIFAKLCLRLFDTYHVQKLGKFTNLKTLFPVVSTKFP